METVKKAKRRRKIPQWEIDKLRRTGQFVFKCRREEGNLLRFDCPFCYDVHTHGAGPEDSWDLVFEPASRGSHCQVPPWNDRDIYIYFTQ